MTPSQSFLLDLSTLEIGNDVGSEFSSDRTFNATCRALANTGTSHQKSGELFRHFRLAIQDGGENIISTGWGGVVIESHAHPHVEKYLVVEGGRFLAFEKHEVKEETLSVREGDGVLLHRRNGSTNVTASRLAPGFERYIAPGEEHCIIACSDLVVFETSEDYKGMDKDLIFLFTPEE